MKYGKSFPFRVTLGGKPWQVRLWCWPYAAGGQAVRLETEEGEPFCDVSVHAYDARHNYTLDLINRHPGGFYLHSWEIPREVRQALEAQRIIERIPGEPEISLGYVDHVPAYRLGPGVSYVTKDPDHEHTAA